GRLHLDALAREIAGQRPLAIDGIAERVDDSPEQPAAHGHVDDSTRALDRIAFLDIAVVAEDHDADIVGLEVQGHAAYAAGELDHLASFNLVEAVDAGDAVADREHRADLRDIGLGAEVLDLLLEDGGDFCGADFHHPTPFIASCSLCSFVFSELSI